MESKKLAGSQRELIRMKREKMKEKVAEAKSAVDDVQIAINNIFLELGYPPSELGKWKVNESDEAFIRIEPQETTVKKRDSHKKK